MRDRLDELHRHLNFSDITKYLRQAQLLFDIFSNSFRSENRGSGHFLAAVFFRTGATSSPRPHWVELATLTDRKPKR